LIHFVIKIIRFCGCMSVHPCFVCVRCTVHLTHTKQQRNDIQPQNRTILTTKWINWYHFSNPAKHNLRASRWWLRSKPKHAGAIVIYFNVMYICCALVGAIKDSARFSVVKLKFSKATQQHTCTQPINTIPIYTMPYNYIWYAPGSTLLRPTSRNQYAQCLLHM